MYVICQVFFLIFYVNFEVHTVQEFMVATTDKMNINGKILLFMLSFLWRVIVVSYILQMKLPPKGRGFCLTAVLRSPVRIFSISYSSPRPRLKRRGFCLAAVLRGGEQSGQDEQEINSQSFGDSIQ